MKTKIEIFYDKLNLTPYIIQAKINETINSLIVEGTMVIQQVKEINKIDFDIRDILTFIFYDRNSKKTIKNFIIYKKFYIDDPNLSQNDKNNKKIVLNLIEANYFSLTYIQDSFALNKSDVLGLMTQILDYHKIKYTKNINDNDKTQLEYILPIKKHIDTFNFLNNKDDNFYIINNFTNNSIDFINPNEMFNNENIVDTFDILKGGYNIIDISLFDFYEFYNNGVFGYKTFEFNKKNGNMDYNIYDSISEINITNKPYFIHKVNRLNFLNQHLFQITVPADKMYILNKKIKIINNSLSYYDGTCLIIKVVHLIDNLGNYKMQLILSNISKIFNQNRG